MGTSEKKLQYLMSSKILQSFVKKMRGYENERSNQNMKLILNDIQTYTNLNSFKFSGFQTWWGFFLENSL